MPARRFPRASGRGAFTRLIERPEQLTDQLEQPRQRKGQSTQDPPSQGYQGLKPGRAKIGNRFLTPFLDKSKSENRSLPLFPNSTNAGRMLSEQTNPQHPRVGNAIVYEYAGGLHGPMWSFRKTT